MDQCLKKWYADLQFITAGVWPFTFLGRKYVIFDWYFYYSGERESPRVCEAVVQCPGLHLPVPTTDTYDQTRALPDCNLSINPLLGE